MNPFKTNILKMDILFLFNENDPKYEDKTLLTTNLQDYDKNILDCLNEKSGSAI